MFEREDWKLFRNLDTLCQKAGVAQKNIPRLVCKELVDNALDVSECELKLEKSLNGFSVRDFGDGIDEGQLRGLFSINRPMLTTKLLRLPTRGALGNGLRVVAGAVVSTDGKIFVETKNVRYEIVFLEDGSSDYKVLGLSDVDKGTRITVSLGKIFQVSDIDLIWGQNTINMGRGTMHSCRTCPSWYTSEAFFELLNSYDGSLHDFLLFFNGINKKNVLGYGFWDLSSKTKELSFAQSEEILGVLRKNERGINPNKLGFVSGHEGWGEYATKHGVFTVKSAKGKYSATIPYVVETWLNFQREYKPFLYVNKTLISGEISWWYDKGTMNLYRLGLHLEIKAKPSQIIINVITPYMPITSDGKSPEFSAMNDLIQKCLEISKRNAKKNYAEENSLSSNKEKDIIFAWMQDAIDKAGGDGQYQFSQRQLYYAIRPHVMMALDKQPEYTYFCKLLTDYENEYGEIDNLYRDPRGTLYHPHTGEEIPLGTISVRNYERPKWTFNKILYCEKEGFFPILRDAKFPERFDCALLTSKGYASRAAKDLFDLLGETNEEILFFCIHDADSAGTMIYQTLQESTLSRRARKVRVINLGLDPWEAIDMGLEVETFESKSKRPVASYVYDYDSDYSNWLQRNRVELNAMTTPRFLAWIEDKISEYDNGKVVPNNRIIEDRLTNETDKIVRQKVMAEILRSNNFEEKVRQENNKVNNAIESLRGLLRQKVRDELEEKPEQHWKDVVVDIAKDITD